VFAAVNDKEQLFETKMFQQDLRDLHSLLFAQA